MQRATPVYRIWMSSLFDMGRELCGTINSYIIMVELCLILVVEQPYWFYGNTQWSLMDPPPPPPSPPSCSQIS